MVLELDVADERVDRRRLIGYFMDLCAADSAPFREGALFREAWTSLSALGFELAQDDAGRKTGGEVGNLIARKSGRGCLASRNPVLLSAHMDRVAGGLGVKPVLC